MSRGVRGDNVGGPGALAERDAKALKFGLQAPAERRALINAAFVGAGVGLALGASYMAAGLGQAAVDHTQPVRLATAYGVAPSLELRPMLVKDTTVISAGALDPDAAKVAKAPPTRARELDCMAQAVYFEARGESPRGQAAVATVIMNRVKSPAFPKTVCGVVYQGAAHHNGCQFSFACDGQAERVVENGAWDRARIVAARVLSGAVLRDVGRATHFHTTGVDPEWGSQMLRTAQVGLHVFYRFNPHAPRPTVEDNDEATVMFASAPAVSVPELRLASALVLPPLPSAPAPQIVEAKPVEPKPAPKPAEAPANLA